MIWRQLLILSLEKFSEIGKVIVTSSVSKLVMISSGLLVRGAVIHFENNLYLKWLLCYKWASQL